MLMTPSPVEEAAPPGVWAALAQILRQTSPKRRRHLYLSLVLMFVGAGAELLTIGAILPFLALLANPNSIQHFALARWAIAYFDLHDDRQIILLATFVVVVVALAAACVRIILAWVSNRFVLRIGHDIGVQIYSRMLRQPYSYYVRGNSSQILAGIEKVQIAIFALLVPLMQGLVATVMATFIIVLLFLIDPFTATAAGLALGLIYICVSLVTGRVLIRNSRVTASAQTERLKLVQEGLGGIREILIDQSQPTFEANFATLDDRYREAQAINLFIGAAPRFIVEAAGVATIALLAYYMTTQPGGVLAAIPVLGTLALGAQRLLPLLQVAYLGWTSLSGTRHVLQDVVDLMNAPVVTTHPRDRNLPVEPFQHSVVLNEVGFRYVEGIAALREVNLTIDKGARIGVIGRTGSGKSTLLDLLMGLLEPTEGQILIDGRPLDDETRSAWQAQIAHVPQSVYLADSSIASNIAFGQTPEEIDFTDVRAAARAAQIDDFIMGLPDNYQTFVGERGVRLSGGQRQRIGLARSLYKRATVLILDEATSALDDQTEAALIAALMEQGRELTILMIAHRLSTLRGCDRLVRMEGGRIVQTGSYDQLVDP